MVKSWQFHILKASASTVNYMCVLCIINSEVATPCFGMWDNLGRGWRLGKRCRQRCFIQKYIIYLTEEHSKGKKTCHNHAMVSASELTPTLMSHRSMSIAVRKGLLTEYVDMNNLEFVCVFVCVSVQSLSPALKGQGESHQILTGVRRGEKGVFHRHTTLVPDPLSFSRLFISS